MSVFLDILYDFYYQYALVESYWFSGAGHEQDAQDAWDIPDDHAALGIVIDWVGHLHNAVGEWVNRYSPVYPRYHLVNLLQKVDDYLTPWEGMDEYELTMDKITSVMITATDDEVKYFIGLIDAYRVGLWNKPFNAEYFAALARGFAL